MEEFVAFGKMLFYICITPLIIYSMKFYILGVSSLYFRRKQKNFNGGKLPRVSVHIPVYNDPVVVECIKKCLNFNYPKDKFEVIVVDDSDDGKTSKLINSLKKEGKIFRLLRRKSRRGFKAGALNDALKISRGDVIAVFDSDYRPGRDFLRRVVQPFFGNENIAFVQTRWGYLNPGKTRISRVAMMCYNAFHQCSMPVKEKLGTAIFCGTGGAIRKGVLVESGGWNEKSIGEDIDLTVRILDKGYKQVYLPDLKSEGEVPGTLKAFVKQQQRWAYATTKVMKDYTGRIMNSKGLSRAQKFDLFFIVTGFLVFPFILGVSISTMMTMAPWFGPNTAGEIFNMENLVRSAKLAMDDMFSLQGILILILSCGYLFECAVALIYERKFRDILLLPYLFAVGFVIQITNTVAVFKALLGVEHKFHRTPKIYYRGS